MSKDDKELVSERFGVVMNTPELWLENLPFKAADAHKYNHGYALIYAAPKLTGATRLAAASCARMGAGLVTVLSDPYSADIFREALDAHIMVRDDLDWYDERINARLYGPGGMVTNIDYTKNSPLVLDADALVDLPAEFTQPTVLTPHEGEFERCFPHIKGNRVDRAYDAAKQSGAVILLKGAKSVVAAPDGRIVVNDHASPDLASAGTGDVLAGMITGLLARGMDPFEAVCAAVWVHGDCAIRFGAGLVAPDLIDLIPQAYQSLIKRMDES